MSGLSVIIPSKTVSNLVPCLSAIFANESTLRLDFRVFVVDDGLDSGWQQSVHFSDPRVTTIKGIKPFNFSQAVNAGIGAAGDDDVILANDDTLLETPCGFTMLQRCGEDHPEFGVISAACNNVGNTFQHLHPGGGLREEPRTVCFVCVLIPRRTINRVGLLDSIYIYYGLNDDGFCLETRRAGLKLGIFDGCFVDHSKLVSSYRGRPDSSGDFRPNLKIFIEKYGVDNWGNDKAHSSWPELFPA